MKIAQVIKVLKSWEKEFGNIEVVMSIDPEGNSYSTLDPRWSFAGVREGEDRFISDQLNKSKTAKDVSDREKEFLATAKMIGVCLYPYYEGYESAERAVKQLGMDKEV